MFQYLSWVNKNSPHWKGNKLLSEAQLSNVKAALMTSTCEVHESVQRYDQDGNVVYTPLYADFDGANCADEVLKYVELIEREFNITPNIYYSGRKGYHVFVNVKIYHTHPHLIARDFAVMFSRQAKTLDMQVFATRHLLRSEGSVHLKSGLFKTRIYKELVGNDVEIKKLASTFAITPSVAHDSRLLNLFIPTLVAKIDMELAIENEKYASVIKYNDGEISPCIRTLLNNQPISGSNNYIITLMARNMNAIGMDLNSAVDIVLQHEQWSGLSREIRATFNSIWKRPSKFGCHKEPLLRAHCDPFCHFNTDVLAV